ncbi:MAG: DUF1080 domain-containing protein [Pseudomonadota bacterium]
MTNSLRLRGVHLAAWLIGAGTAFTATATAAIPEGFTPLFDGHTARGWHVSRSSHQGVAPRVEVRNGELHLSQQVSGQGGVLLTDRTYLNFELYLETRPDEGCDGGVFLRSTESGNAYQVNLDNLGPDAINGSLVSEGRPVSPTAVNQTKAWRRGDWNSFRVRVTGGDTPRLMLWINDELAWDVTQARSRLIPDVQGGAIGLQIHFSSAWPGGPSPRWIPGGIHRFRNIGIRELP